LRRGVINTFGVYQTYYEGHILTSSTPSAISWIGSVQAFLLLLVGALTGPIYDAGYFRVLLITGSIAMPFGLFMLSLASEYYQVLLAQGFCVGLSAGLLFVPSVAILSTYFTTKLATATGIAAAGSSLGGVIYPIMFHRLLPRIGFAWSTRVVGFIVLGTLLIPNAVMRMRVLPPARRKMIDLKAFKEAPYSLFIVGGFFGFMGLYPPFYYIQLYALKQKAVDPNLSFYLLSVLNASSTFGRLLPNMIADKAGPLNIVAPCALITGILSLCLIPMETKGAIFAFCVLYGFFSGTFVSLPPTVLVHLTPDRRFIGTRMGMAFSIYSIGLLIGSPIAGAILDTGFTHVWIFSGVTTIFGASVMILARVAKYGWNPLVKA
jgi:MFS family permease